MYLMKKLISKGKVLTLLLEVGFALNVSSAKIQMFLFKEKLHKMAILNQERLRVMCTRRCVLKYLKEHHPMLNMKKKVV